eukprot:CAMPEP_0202963240 /NCGR_PEP_ID=MMETSP1396-20130829/7225_1 /ASSEMBLY_ACC=CAM_ASM_000872 /TAXON_ID= /ORGANISM="Pseudokeronopsis sp., Strain Brazil" /LENGTH=198 /DNA_ID=CAMNT_0049684281 /DNA_START=224 /DNA_END=817 /DNA_ORIENTATION=+
MLFYGGISNAGFLACSDKALMDFGEKYPYYMKYEWQVWRFLTSGLLHADFLHVTTNIFVQIAIGSSLEANMGAKNMAVFYFLSAIGGTAFSTLFKDDPQVGASIGVYGMCGIYISFIIIHYDQIKDNTQVMCTLILFIIFLLLFLLIMTSTNYHVDMLGNFGGLLMGIPLGIYYLPPNPNMTNEKLEKLWKAGMLTYW